MKESENEFDEIVNQAQEYYSLGEKAGFNQASTYTMEEIQEEGYSFGQQFGEEYTMYEQFIKMMEQNIIEQQNSVGLSAKVLAQVQNFKSILKKIDFENIQVIKSKRKLLASKFKVLLAMLGVKGYAKDNQEKNSIKQEEEPFDF